MAHEAGGQHHHPAAARRLETMTWSLLNSTRQPSRWARRSRVESTDQSVLSKAACMGAA
ncbi:hypothetical protein ACFQY5_19220 [Paeniroseomonas aquatica]|uniref:hypothetical protein n=1 Tax=Paeniroseomonas aquatica TaxID=373043 RepID=UPI00360E6036